MNEERDHSETLAKTTNSGSLIIVDCRLENPCDKFRKDSPTMKVL